MCHLCFRPTSVISCRKLLCREEKMTEMLLFPCPMVVCWWGFSSFLCPTGFKRGNISMETFTKKTETSSERRKLGGRLFSKDILRITNDVISTLTAFNHSNDSNQVCKLHSRLQACVYFCQREEILNICYLWMWQFAQLKEAGSPSHWTSGRFPFFFPLNPENCAKSSWVLFTSLCGHPTGTHASRARPRVRRLHELGEEPVQKTYKQLECGVRTPHNSIANDLNLWTPTLSYFIMHLPHAENWYVQFLRHPLRWLYKLHGSRQTQNTRAAKPPVCVYMYGYMCMAWKLWM